MIPRAYCSFVAFLEVILSFGKEPRKSEVRFCAKCYVYITLFHIAFDYLTLNLANVTGGKCLGHSRITVTSISTSSIFFDSHIDATCCSSIKLGLHAKV